jgi:hypothetical protein
MDLLAKVEAAAFNMVTTMVWYNKRNNKQARADNNKSKHATQALKSRRNVGRSVCLFASKRRPTNTKEKSKIDAYFLESVELVKKSSPCARVKTDVIAPTTKNSTPQLFFETFSLRRAHFFSFSKNVQ